MVTNGRWRVRRSGNLFPEGKYVIYPLKMKKTLNKLYQRYTNEWLRFNVHLAVYIVTVLILWLISYVYRNSLGTEWIIVITLIWTVILIIHFFLSRWQRGRFRKRKHRF
ncbi:MAG: hypothetical protein DI535_17785 [Citrobacter freundii]|nr:MAG: hypothetical protein DI535_17785 [Citrobacter freundii]